MHCKKNGPFIGSFLRHVWPRSSTLPINWSGPKRQRQWIEFLGICHVPGTAVVISFFSFSVLYPLNAITGVVIWFQGGIAEAGKGFLIGSSPSTEESSGDSLQLLQPATVGLWAQKRIQKGIMPFREFGTLLTLLTWPSGGRLFFPPWLQNTALTFRDVLRFKEDHGFW